MKNFKSYVVRSHTFSSDHRTHYHHHISPLVTPVHYCHIHATFTSAEVTSPPWILSSSNLSFNITLYRFAVQMARDAQMTRCTTNEGTSFCVGTAWARWMYIYFFHSLNINKRICNLRCYTCALPERWVTHNETF